MEQNKMEMEIREIARRIRESREIAGYSQQEMASKADVTIEQYQLLEAGQGDFSFTFIYKCAQAFGVEVTDLLEGSSPTLSSYTVTRKGEGMELIRRKGFTYNHLAPLFKHKLGDPFRVTAPYSEAEQDQPIALSSHAGQEFDIVVKGMLKVQVGEHVEVLQPGDTIFYDSATPHGMIATAGQDCEFYAVVLPPRGKAAQYTAPQEAQPTHPYQTESKAPRIIDAFATVSKDDSGVVNGIRFTNEDNFNFTYDIVDALAAKNPDKLAMLHISREKEERRFTFGDMSKYSGKAANYFANLGIKKGDKVMLVLKRHYQFWFSILALHRIGAVVIPVTNLLVKHDFEYRFDAAGVSAIVCTADGDVANQVDLAAPQSKTLRTKILVGGTKEGWHDFNAELEAFDDTYPRTADTAAGNDTLLMFFTSGTTGYPKIATHNHKYPLGHYLTAKEWHNVNPDGLHFTISDTGWGKALWGKLYGQWMCEGAIFTYDFDKFEAKDILPMFGKYQITTFCAPPTMYRFFIKDDLSKYDLTSLEYATVAGEALNPEVYQQWLKATGVKLMEGFGQTETTLAVANFVGTEPKPGSMGKPSPLFDMDIVLPDGTSAKTGEIGEIVINTEKGNPCGLFEGYYLAEEKTKEAWYDNLYHTGDTAWKDEDGYFWYVGRVDDLIKSSGYRIGPFEIESVIMELPYVLECAVTPVPDEVRGQIVKATIVLTQGTPATDALKKEVQTYVKTHTAPYKYPRIVEFTDALPKTISGKIRRVELREGK